jgi:threonine synthase
MSARLICFNNTCKRHYDVTEVIYNCPACGGLLEAEYTEPLAPAATLKQLWRVAPDVE